MRVSGLKVADIIELGERLVRNFSEHRMATFAAALAYRGLFALLPFMLILVVLVGMLGSPDFLDRLIGEAKSQSSQQVPQANHIRYALHHPRPSKHKPRGDDHRERDDGTGG